MNKLRIIQAVNTNIRHGDTDRRNHCFAWGELILLYEDRTWEKIFEYRWKDPDEYYSDAKRFNSGKLHGITREEGLEKLEEAYFSGKIKGVFMD